jgi:hypothetical protein
VVDSLDVADLESEAAHAYQLLGARENEQDAHEGTSPLGEVVVDGGRKRTEERFAAELRPGAVARVIVRLAARPGTHASVAVAGRRVTGFDAGDEGDDWEEQSFEIPRADAGGRTAIEVRFSGAVTVYHYWFVTPG